MTIRAAFQDFQKKITPLLGEAEARSVARIVFEDAFGITNFQREDEFLFADRSEQILVRLRQHEPVQYVLGEADFFGLKFRVSPAVLIPRQETAELVFEVLNQMPASRLNLHILDIGTGSGCIPVALKKQRPQWTVSAIDVSEAALEIATQNALQNEVTVHFAQADILKTDDPKLFTNQLFDAIISNPPYIPHRESELMPERVKAWEPGLALFVHNNDKAKRKVGLELAEADKRIKIDYFIPTT